MRERTSRPMRRIASAPVWMPYAATLAIDREICREEDRVDRGEILASYLAQVSPSPLSGEPQGAEASRWLRRVVIALPTAGRCGRIDPLLWLKHGQLPSGLRSSLIRV
jgi:hypothetical protein